VDDHEALALARDGQPLLEGCRRALDVLAQASDLTFSATIPTRWRRVASLGVYEWWHVGIKAGQRHKYGLPIGRPCQRTDIEALATVELRNPLADVHALAIVLAHVRGGRVEVTR
jgi:hypothetical protein